jgi:hypothetical protein
MQHQTDNGKFVIQSKLGVHSITEGAKLFQTAAVGTAATLLTALK